MQFIKGARTWRSILGTQSFLRPQDPPPPWVNGTGNSPSLGQLTPGVVKQDKSSGGSVDTTKTRSGPQRVRMSSGERPIGAAKGKQTNTIVPTRPPPQVSLSKGLVVTHRAAAAAVAMGRCCSACAAARLQTALHRPGLAGVQDKAPFVGTWRAVQVQARAVAGAQRVTRQSPPSDEKTPRAGACCSGGGCSCGARLLLL